MHQSLDPIRAKIHFNLKLGMQCAGNSREYTQAQRRRMTQEVSDKVTPFATWPLSSSSKLRSSGI